MAKVTWSKGKSNSGGGFWSQLRQAAQKVAQYASRNAQPAQRQAYARGAQQYYTGNRQTALTANTNYNQGRSIGETMRNQQVAQQQKAAAQRAAQSTKTNWYESFRANYPEFSPPTSRTLPDTYAGQAQRFSQQRYAQYGSEFRLMPDTYLGQGESVAQQLLGPQPTHGGASKSGGGYGGTKGYGGGGGYGGYGYGGWGNGGGGFSYEPPKPEYWLQLVTWNINRPEGG